MFFPNTIYHVCPIYSVLEIHCVLLKSFPFHYRIGLKCYFSLPVVAGALFVGLPYSISLVAQWLYGWPNKPGYQKYIEALKPRWLHELTLHLWFCLWVFSHSNVIIFLQANILFDKSRARDAEVSAVWEIVLSVETVVQRWQK